MLKNVFSVIRIHVLLTNAIKSLTQARLNFNIKRASEEPPEKGQIGIVYAAREWHVAEYSYGNTWKVEGRYYCHEVELYVPVPRIPDKFLESGYCDDTAFRED